MEILDDDLLQMTIDTEKEFIRRYQEKYQKLVEMDMCIVLFLEELKRRRQKELSSEVEL